MGLFTPQQGIDPPPRADGGNRMRRAEGTSFSRSPQVPPRSDAVDDKKPAAGETMLVQARRRSWRRHRRLFFIPYLAEKTGAPLREFVAPDQPVAASPSHQEATVRETGTAFSEFPAGFLARLMANFTQARPRRSRRPRAAGPGDSDPAPNWLLLRLAIGLAQGTGILLLLLAHDRGIWPGTDSFLSTGLLLAGLMAPLAALEGLAQVETRLLLLWSGTLGFVIATLGVWLEWRGGIALIPVAAIALFGLMAHITARAILCDGGMKLRRDGWAEIAWTVSTRMLVWGAVTALAFILISSLGGQFEWMKTARFPLLGLVSAVGFTVADDNWLQRHTRSALPLCATIAIPFLGAAALILLGLYLVGARVSGASLLGLAAFLTLAIHVCDRESLGGRWRKITEGVAGAIILALALVASGILLDRARTGGWTEMRILGAAVAALLALCALAVMAAALPAARIAIPAPRLSLPRRIFPPKRVFSPGPARPAKPFLAAKPVRYRGTLIAVLAACLCLVLATPFLERAAMAAKARLANLPLHIPSLNLAWLVDLPQKQARARIALTAPAPAAKVAAAKSPPARPAPAEPDPRPTGANIRFHTEGEFPASLLTQDWSTQTVPGCLKNGRAPCDAWFLDLDGDGRQELLLTEGDDAHFHGTVMKLEDGRWMAAAALAAPPCRGLLSAMRSRGILVARSQWRWRDVLVGGMRLTPLPAIATLPCPSP